MRQKCAALLCHSGGLVDSEWVEPLQRLFPHLLSLTPSLAHPLCATPLLLSSRILSILSICVILLRYQFIPRIDDIFLLWLLLFQ